ncbi:MAG: response regulator [Polyangiales bacterium]
MLVVDDDPGVRDVCTALFHALGYRAAEASCGASALEAATCRGGEHLHLVLLDLEMPGMRGDEVMRALKAARPNVRVLLMSGRPSNDLRAYLDRGADGVLRKPFGLRDLDDSVGALLSE